MLTYDPPIGTPGIDDNGPNTPPDPDPAPGRAHCRSCGGLIAAFGPAVCRACIEVGFCSICGLEHRATQCPDVVRARLDMEAVERALHRQIIADAAARILARYERSPIWQEAA